MRSDTVTKGVQQAPHRSLFNALGMTKEELEKSGCNFSNTHVDFMFGSKDMEVIGVTKDKKVVKIFENGNFVI